MCGAGVSDALGAAVRVAASGCGTPVSVLFGTVLARSACGACSVVDALGTFSPTVTHGAGATAWVLFDTVLAAGDAHVPTEASNVGVAVATAACCEWQTGGAPGALVLAASHSAGATASMPCSAE